jgi:hypothetical protein
VIPRSPLRNIRNRPLLGYPTPAAQVALLSLISGVGNGLDISVRRLGPGNLVLTFLLRNELR